MASPPETSEDAITDEEMQDTPVPASSPSKEKPIKRNACTHHLQCLSNLTVNTLQLPR
jgi:hypothetical protein